MNLIPKFLKLPQTPARQSFLHLPYPAAALAKTEDLQLGSFKKSNSNRKVVTMGGGGSIPEPTEKPPALEDNSNILTKEETNIFHIFEIHSNTVGLTIGGLLALGISACAASCLYRKWRKRVAKQHVKKICRRYAVNFNPQAQRQVVIGMDGFDPRRPPPSRAASAPPADFPPFCP